MLGSAGRALPGVRRPGTVRCRRGRSWGSWCYGANLGGIGVEGVFLEVDGVEGFHGAGVDVFGGVLDAHFGVLRRLIWVGGCLRIV
jgi:hypothetical protein